MVAYGKMSANPAANPAANHADLKYAIIVPLESILAGSYAQIKKQAQESQAQDFGTNLDSRYSLDNPDVVREGISYNLRLMKKMDVQVPKGILIEINDSLNTYSRFSKAIGKLNNTCDYNRFIQELDVIGTLNSANGNSNHEIYDSDVSHANNALLDDLILLKRELNALGKKDYFNKREYYIRKGTKRFADDFRRFIQLAGQRIPRHSAGPQAMSASAYSAQENSAQENLGASRKNNSPKTLSDRIYESYAYIMSDDCKSNKQMNAKTLYGLARENLSEEEIYKLNNRIRTLSISIEEEKSEKKKIGFLAGLESIVGFSKDYERIDDDAREHALRNIALLAYSGVKKQLKEYSGLGPDLKIIVGQYAENLDFRTKFSGAGKNRLSFEKADAQLDLYKFVHDKRVNENMKYKDIAAAARAEMVDYLAKNLKFSEESSAAQMRLAITNLLPSESRFMPQSTMKRMIEAYKTYSEQAKQDDVLQNPEDNAKLPEQESVRSDVVSMADFKSRKKKAGLAKEEGRESQETITQDHVRELQRKFQQQRN